jgi:peroxiredoxin
LKNQTTLELDARRILNRSEEIPPDVLALFDRATASLIASGVSKNALKAGDHMPDFTLNDAHGKPVRLQDLLELGPVVVSFYRGGWCPYCNIELRGLQRALPQMKELGATLVAISPELPDNTLSTEEKNGLAFPVLSDHGNKVAKSFGIAFKLPDYLIEAYANFHHGLGDVNREEGAEELPIPATFVVDRTGIVRLAFVEEDYYKRLDPDTILESLAGL